MVRSKHTEDLNPTLNLTKSESNYVKLHQVYLEKILIYELRTLSQNINASQIIFFGN